MTPEEIKQRLNDEGRCHCGLKLRCGEEECSLCTSINKSYNSRETSDVIPVCTTCKKECEYFWITKNGVTTCANCIGPEQVLAA